VQFKYMLEGYDKEWINGGNSRTASYTRYRSGTYRFRVIASNNDGVWNTVGASLVTAATAALLSDVVVRDLCVAARDRGA
jgi:hypothetical protein